MSSIKCLLSNLQAVVQPLEGLMEDHVEGLLQVHTRMLNTLQFYGRLYGRQVQQLQKLQDELQVLP